MEFGAGCAEGSGSGVLRSGHFTKKKAAKREKTLAERSGANNTASHGGIYGCRSLEK